MAETGKDEPSLLPGEELERALRAHEGPATPRRRSAVVGWGRRRRLVLIGAAAAAAAAVLSFTLLRDDGRRSASIGPTAAACRTLSFRGADYTRRSLDAERLHVGEPLGSRGRCGAGDRPSVRVRRLQGVDARVAIVLDGARGHVHVAEGFCTGIHAGGSLLRCLRAAA
ncbi:MAG: hypothetical protein M3R70_05570 [Actinomycetota bacterium]|nr:hypothetical protein [Actinomycetota bacterium]